MTNRLLRFVTPAGRRGRPRCPNSPPEFVEPEPVVPITALGSGIDDESLVAIRHPCGAPRQAAASKRAS
ncbi:MAG: hypothetical protein AB7F89_21045, partial [Pirellulaceae bacterium]